MYIGSTRMAQMFWIIFCVLFACAVLGLVMWLTGRFSMKAEKKPWLLRGPGFLLAAVYLITAIVVISGVVTGSDSAWSLLGLPIPLGLGWFYLRTAQRLPAPPGEPEGN
jgi:hypothetical protein